MGILQTKNTGMGCHALLQGIRPTQGLNSGLPHCRQITIWVTREAQPKMPHIYFIVYQYGSFASNVLGSMDCLLKKTEMSLLTQDEESDNSYINWYNTISNNNMILSIILLQCCNNCNIRRGLLIIRWVILCVYVCECSWAEHHTYKPYSSPSCQGEPFLCFYPLLWKCFQFYFSFSHFPETIVFLFFSFFLNLAVLWQG